MQFVSLADILKEMDKGEPFAITFCTANRKKKSGGEMIQLEGCVLHNRTKASSKAPHAVKDIEAEETTISRPPHHNQNDTRNIRLANGQVRKLHIRLITSFNNKTVIW